MAFILEREISKYEKNNGGCYNHFNFVFVAFFTINRNYTVTFETNGGTVVNPLTTKKKTKIDNVPYTQKDGFVFDGWFKDSNFYEPWNF